MEVVRHVVDLGCGLGATALFLTDSTLKVALAGRDIVALSANKLDAGLNCPLRVRRGD